MSKFGTNILEVEDLSKFLDSGLIVQKTGSSEFILGIGISDLDQGFCRESSFFQGSFFNTKFEYLNTVKTVCVTIEGLISFLGPILNNRLTLEEIRNFDEAYLEDVKESIFKLENNSDIEKIVTVSYAEYAFNEVHPLSAIESILNLNGHLYGRWSGGQGFLGVSPEPLLYKQKNSDCWKTMALAGTISTEVSNFESVLLNDIKEQEEHKLVVDDLGEKLLGLEAEISIGKTHCFNFGPIAHLKTDIEFRLDRTEDINALITCLGPSAALGGYPSKSSTKYLKELRYFNFEKDFRAFGGVFGVEYGGEVFSYVMIRNIFWNKDKAFIHSGTGIVKNSVPERELSELRNKRSAILRTISI